MKRQTLNGGRGHHSRVVKVPTELVFCDGKRTVVADSQGYSVDVGPGLGTVAGVEIIRHAVGTDDPGREKKS